MGVCVSISPDGFLVANNTPLSECSSYVLTSSSEYNLAYTDLFSSSNIAPLLFLGFGLILGGYLISAPVGVVIDFIKRL